MIQPKNAPASGGEGLARAGHSLLITQCLQNDFVKPIGRFDPIPNQLHVGHAEALRLLGETPAEGPVERMMQWAYAQPDELVRVVHIRDWHDPSQPEQRSHLAQFGEHCIRDTEGARFVFTEPQRHAKDIALINSVTLNDFEGTGLTEVLAPYGSGPCRVGLTGVWTEAKVLFLAYEIRTRFPEFEIAVCSALTASSSRQHHFQALSQLDRIIGVQVIDSVGGFIDWLGGGTTNAPLLGLREKYPVIDAGEAQLDPTDAMLLRFLFRDCRSVTLKLLGGGFSGNLVAGTTSVDLHGHEQVPHVVKIGPQDKMGRERTNFEQVQDVMGNNAPQISDFADLDDRGAIKYRYASMGGSFTTTFQKEYQRGLALEKVEQVINTVYGEQLMRLYKAATLESGDLLEHYFFAPERAPGVQRSVEQIVGHEVPGDTLELLPGVEVTNPAVFYRRTLAQLPARAQDRFYQAHVHGDLNGQNIVLDGHDNVWLIDFFHTRRAHVLMDLVKMENDLFYIFTPVQTEHELREAFKLTDALIDVQDLWAELPAQCPSTLPQMQRAWATLRMLRAYYRRLVHSDRAPLQLFVAMLRYAGHTLSFDEPTPLQLKWALYTAARCVDRVQATLTASTRLRVDFLELADEVSSGGPGGRVGLTVLPGRRDWRRHLREDLGSLREAGVDAVVCLVPHEELERYGVPELIDAYRDSGLATLHMPLLDQKGASADKLREAAAWVQVRVAAGQSVLVHCVGGLGRSGMVAAAWLRSRGVSADDALQIVRAARGPRAVETKIQERCVRTLRFG
ncbi:Protein-tyrosine phosphatase-related protein [Enhygromyxa salina]|uniref:protein-tyrosine-phosphatase n=2 Tax=Enhygromyxa salina TaxID=215803 RepID=A0A0C1ZV82_9BACT|nr:Protein-tyrosine phosphatase-related protein [Enhygromyxa salina]